jgi:hypothetical protein
VKDRENVWSLAFADDMMIVAMSDQEPGKGCEEEKVNVERTKMMLFNKIKRKSEDNEWKWEGKSHG